MKTSVCDWPPKASIAAAPVSPEVAPRMVARVWRSRKRAVHQPAEPLHGEILERQRRPVEQFEQEEIVVELDERGGRRVAKSRVGVLGEGRERRRCPFRRRRRAEPAASPPRRKARPASARISAGVDRGGVSRRVEAAVAGQAREHRFGKTERRRFAARGDIAHVPWIPWLEPASSSASRAKGETGTRTMAGKLRPNRRQRRGAPPICRSAPRAPRRARSWRRTPARGR